MAAVSRDTCEALAELHWISYSMAQLPFKVPGEVPKWEDLPAAQRSCLTTAMEIMITLDHIRTGHSAPSGD